ncbi:MAG: hypothetical protein K2X87_07980 [Gemmataceae bacterium]|nr:hypothetical protein [Gemmataceae bacterium]
MAYREFTFPEVETRLGLRMTTDRLFRDVPAVTPDPDLLSRLEDGVELGTGINTEKARSEFIVALILLEFRRLVHRRHAVFSGVTFDVDPVLGLNGYCDFLITRSPRLDVVTAPVVAVAEGKNGVVTDGLGQCIAEMRAAWLFNTAKGEPVQQVYGACTTGTNWKFLRLRDLDLAIDLDEYTINAPGKILGILLHMVQTA